MKNTNNTHKNNNNILSNIKYLAIAILLLTQTLYINEARATRIKDIVDVEGIRTNALLGYGLVVGLNGTGDKLNNSAFTEKSLRSFLDRIGINTNDINLKVKNVAAVAITATLEPFARTGSHINVTVSALGDAKSLQGGILLSTPLKGIDGNIYALAQGPVAIAGFSATGKNDTSIKKGVPTTGFIANGATIENEISFELNSMKNIRLALLNPDITTARNITKGINQLNITKNDIAKMTDSSTVLVSIPKKYSTSVADLLAKIEQVNVKTDQEAKITIDEASGTIVMNDNVTIDKIAIAQGNLIVRINEGAAISQAQPLAPGGETVVTQASEIQVSEQGMRMAVMEKTANLNELVDGLNALGVGPRDLINILRTIKSSGALQAKIESM